MNENNLYPTAIGERFEYDERGLLIRHTVLEGFIENERDSLSGYFYDYRQAQTKK